MVDPLDVLDLVEAEIQTLQVFERFEPFDGRDDVVVQIQLRDGLTPRFGK